MRLTDNFCAEQKTSKNIDLPDLKSNQQKVRQTLESMKAPLTLKKPSNADGLSAFDLLLVIAIVVMIAGFLVVSFVRGNRSGASAIQFNADGKVVVVPGVKVASR